jgi:hypothetical protein
MAKKESNIIEMGGKSKRAPLRSENLMGDGGGDRLEGGASFRN